MTFYGQGCSHFLPIGLANKLVWLVKSPWLRYTAPKKCLPDDRSESETIARFRHFCDSGGLAVGRKPRSLEA
jgi:hypothetical protein